MDRNEALELLREAKRLRKAAAEAKETAAEATERAIVAAFEVKIGPTEIASEAGVSDSYVRAVRREHKIPANPSYAHLQPTPRAKNEEAS